LVVRVIKERQFFDNPFFSEHFRKRHVDYTTWHAKATMKDRLFFVNRQKINRENLQNSDNRTLVALLVTFVTTATTGHEKGAFAQKTQPQSPLSCFWEIGIVRA
jgi:hypothetical protein